MLLTLEGACLFADCVLTLRCATIGPFKALEVDAELVPQNSALFDIVQYIFTRSDSEFLSVSNADPREARQCLRSQLSLAHACVRTTNWFKRALPDGLLHTDVLLQFLSTSLERLLTLLTDTAQLIRDDVEEMQTRRRRGAAMPLELTAMTSSFSVLGSVWADIIYIFGRYPRQARVMFIELGGLPAVVQALQNPPPLPSEPPPPALQRAHALAMRLARGAACVFLRSATAQEPRRVQAGQAVLIRALFGRQQRASVYGNAPLAGSPAGL
jgi:hypothetical protein